MKAKGVSILKKRKKLLITAIIFAIIIIINVIISAVYRPIGPALTISAYMNGIKVEKLLKETYTDDKFTLVLMLAAQRGTAPQDDDAADEA